SPMPLQLPMVVSRVGVFFRRDRGVESDRIWFCFVHPSCIQDAVDFLRPVSSVATPKPNR
ncbi:hypothetical protein, partial [Hydrogenibacillus schlegelii]|uniref:hypothetical protein n=1 Tax=Hydrogenibacillus schlegelii TaxID=1484 RepID=UPI0034A00A1A